MIKLKEFFNKSINKIYSNMESLQNLINSQKDLKYKKSFQYNQLDNFIERNVQLNIDQDYINSVKSHENGFIMNFISKELKITNEEMMNILARNKIAKIELLSTK